MWPRTGFNHANHALQAFVDNVAVKNVASIRIPSFLSVKPPLAVSESLVCEVCYRTFSRESDKKRHKCTTERLSQQMGAVQCTNCNRWFRSKGGFSVHICSPEGRAYFVSSFVPKFWGCVTILIQQQYNRTGQVCVHIHVCLRERVHSSA